MTTEHPRGLGDHNPGRAAAVERLTSKRNFRNHVAIYLAVNAMLVVIWAASGAGYFWPVWPILGWGIGLAADAWRVHGQRPFTEDDIRREAQRDTSWDSESAGR